MTTPVTELKNFVHRLYIYITTMYIFWPQCIYK